MSPVFLFITSLSQILRLLYRGLFYLSLVYRSLLSRRLLTQDNNLKTTLGMQTSYLGALSCISGSALFFAVILRITNQISKPNKIAATLPTAIIIMLRCLSSSLF